MAAAMVVMNVVVQAVDMAMAESMVVTVVRSLESMAEVEATAILLANS